MLPRPRLWASALAPSYRARLRALYRAMPSVEARAAGAEGGGRAMYFLAPPSPANAAHSIRFHRPGGGTLRTAPFRTPGNKRRPGPLDDLRNSFLTTSLTRPRALRGSVLRRIVGPFL